MKYYERLKETRIDKDISQLEVAKAIGTTQQQIYKYENGLQSMTIERFIDICAFYNVSADFILGLKGKEKSGRTQNCTKYAFLYNRKETGLKPACFFFSFQPLLLRSFTEKRYRDEIRLPIRLDGSAEPSEA